MARITDDPNDPDVKRGAPDTEPVVQNKAYLVLSEADRAKGFVRPVRSAYRHVGILGPQFKTRPLTEAEILRHKGLSVPYVAYEPYPEDHHSEATGRMWTRDQLAQVVLGCGSVTTMSVELAETYARQPGFYGSTYCVSCQMHRPVGMDGEFVWDGTDERVGT